MATAPVTPAAPVAAAPAPVATPTPVATPAATETAAPVVETPVTAVETPAADAPKTAPKSEDFDSNEDYLAAKFEFEDQAGTLGAVATEIDPNAPAPEVADPNAVADDPNEPALLPPELQGVTPEALSGWMEKSPEFKAVMEASPELKENLFAMARDNAKYAPIAEIFPDVESAKFANETAGNYVELTTAFQMSAEDPETFPQAFSKFEDLFRLRDEKGEYLRDAAGNIRVGEDFNLLSTHLVSGYHQGELKTFERQAKDLEARIENAVYPNAEAKAADEAALDKAQTAIAALRYVEGLRVGEEAKPDLSKIADPEVRAYYEKKEKELDDQRKALGQDKTDAAKSQRKQARTTYENDFRGKFGGTVGKRIGELVKEKLDGGTFIPSYVLEDRDPKTNAPLFAVRVLNEFEKKIHGVAAIREKQAKLQLLPPSQTAMEQRLRYHQELIEAYLPGILDTEVRKVQTKEKADREARRTKTGNRNNVAEMEPRSGATPQPRVMTEEQVEVQAMDAVKKMPGFEAMSPAEINTARMEHKFRLKYGGAR